MTHSNLERELETRGRELMRILLQEHLDSRRPGLCEQPVCGADGIERPRVRLHDCKLESVFGTVVASRSGYGQEGVESLHPLDAEKRKQKMGKRLSKGEKKNAKRMATVYTTEPFVRAPEDLIAEASCTLDKAKRPRPEQKRVWASLEKTPKQVISGAFAEACEYKRNHQDLYAGGVIPTITASRLSPKRNHLKVIK